MRILGIDPGLQTTGFGVVELQSGVFQYVASGTISTSALPTKPLAPRLKLIFEGIQEVVHRYQPSVAACEIVFVNVNPQSTLLLGQARGTALAALAVSGLVVHEYTALQLKQAVTGYGKASKIQVQTMMQHLLKLPQLPGKDAADALGLAITHGQIASTHHRWRTSQ